MDQVTGNSTQNLEPPWPMQEKAQDQQPSSVSSTAQPRSHNSSGPLNRSNSCPRCSAVFMLPKSLKVHMETAHTDDDLPLDLHVESRLQNSTTSEDSKKEGNHLRPELPVASGLHKDTCEGTTKKIHSERGGCSKPVPDDTRGDSTTPSVADDTKRNFTTASDDSFCIKLEPSWSSDEEPQAQPPAVHRNMVQPTPDNTSESLLSLNSSPICWQCSASFALLSSWELHMVTFHADTLYNSFPMYSACKDYGVDNHHHHGSKNENIGNCNNKKTVKDKKGKDTSRTDQKQKIKKHVCDVCSKAFALVGDLNRHKLTHTSQKMFSCDVCNKSFNRATHLQTHKRTHTGERPYVCTDCGKGFAHSSNLKNHQLTHTGVKPHSCNVCEAAFAETGNLKQHMRTHTGHKPYVCTICGKGFALSGDLKRHRLIHTGEKPHTCPHCPAAFTTTGNLKKHIQKLHPFHLA